MREGIRVGALAGRSFDAGRQFLGLLVFDPFRRKRDPHLIAEAGENGSATARLCVPRPQHRADRRIHPIELAGFGLAPGLAPPDAAVRDRLPQILEEGFRMLIGFEDTVIFVHDVDRSLEKLDWFEKELIGKIVLQEYSQDQAAILLGCWRRTVARRYLEAVDRLTEIFLEGGLLTALPEQDSTYSESCQEEETEENSASDSEW